MQNEAKKAIEDSRTDATGKFCPNYGKAASLLARRQHISIDEAFAWINKVRYSR